MKPSFETSLSRSSLRNPDTFETLSSYLAAWCGERGVSRIRLMEHIGRSSPTVAVALTMDPDFPSHPDWAKVVEKITHIPSQDLLELATPLGPWHLAPPCRRHACLACLGEAGTPAKQARSKLWTYATITTCWMHDLPLVEVPAVGWQWMELSAVSRKSHGELMLRPERLVPQVTQVWHRLGEEFRNSLALAEMHAWVAPGAARLREFLHYEELDEQFVWEDLLVLLCSSWQNYPTASLGLRGIPSQIGFNMGRQYFGSTDSRVLLNPPTLDFFKSITSTAERRACVAVATSEIRNFKRRFRFDDYYGWSNVLRYMPDHAWGWLVECSKIWPARWQGKLDEWDDFRKKSSRLHASSKNLPD